METTFFQQFKQRASKLIEPSFLKPGRVLAVRRWEQADLIAVDLHLPEAEMSDWREVPYIKFRVADFTVRDYSPSSWDAETQTCTLVVDAGHDGPGARWAKQLKQEDQVHYLKVDTTHQSPHPTSLVVALGDASSFGHFLGLQQMVYPANRFTGAIVFNDKLEQEKFSRDFRTPLTALQLTDQFGIQTLATWVKAQNFSAEHTAFYLSGNNKMVSEMRKLLKQSGYLPANIRVKGFWS